MRNTLAVATMLAALLLSLTVVTVAQLSPQNTFQQAVDLLETKGNVRAAMKLFEETARSSDRSLAARSLFYLGACHEKLGEAQVKEARAAYERVVRDFGDQAEVVAQARVRLAALGGPGGAGGLVTRRILADASGVTGVLTADGKYIRHIDRDTGDVVQFEVASGQTSHVKNRRTWSEDEKGYDDQVFSRDGERAAYSIEISRSDTKDWAEELRIRNLDGSGHRTLCTYEKSSSNAELLDWSPDGESILALRGIPSKANDLALISTTNGSVRVLRSIASAWYMLKKARFSPDGRFIAFSLVRDGSPPHSDVFLMTADGRNEVVVAGHPAEDELLEWTPDGRSLLFLSNRSGTWDIWTVHIAEGKQQGEPEVLKKDFGYDAEVFGFGPDGSLYYRTDTLSGGLYAGEIDLETGKVLVPPTPVTTRYTGPPYNLTWSPDGKSLAYVSHEGNIGPGNNILTIRSAATGEERFLSPRLRYVNQISWAPDGRSVLALGFTEKESGIFRIDTETSGITKLQVGAWEGRGLVPKLCPDGKTLVFVGEGPTIRKRNLDTGEESEVVKSGIHYGLSPDCREVVFQVDGAVKAMPLNGGEPRELFRGLARLYGLGYTRDGRYIIARALYTGTEIWRVPAQGGAPLKLDLSVPKTTSFVINRDSRRFALTVNEGSKSELWALENFLRPSKSAAKQ